MASERRRKSLKHERRVLWLALLTGVPGLVLALALLWSGDFAPRTQWTLTTVVMVVWLGLAATLREHVIRPLQTISNMLAALRERDFSMRARGSNPADALGLLLLELNGLGEDLRAQRLGALEATALLRRVMEEIDVAVFAFDGSQALRLVNRAGAALLGRPREQALGRGAAELGLGPCFTAEAPGVVELELAGARGRWEVRRGTFRQEGLPHELLVLADVSRTLSREERQAWQRLIRARPRAQQFARPHQVLGAEPRGAGATRSAATRLEERPRQWARRHRQSGRVAQPIDGRVRATRPATRSPPRATFRC